MPRPASGGVITSTRSSLLRAVATAMRAAGIAERATCHAFGQSSAAYLLERGYDIRTVQEPPGHKDASTTMIYTHVVKPGPAAVQGPMDTLAPLPARDPAEGALRPPDERNARAPLHTSPRWR